MSSLDVRMCPDPDAQVATSTVQATAPTGDQIAGRLDPATGGFVVEALFVTEAGARRSLVTLHRTPGSNRVLVESETEAR